MTTAFRPRRFFGVLAIAAGAARIATTFLVDWSRPSLPLEAVALAVDFGLLFGLTGFYFANVDRLGLVGLLGYLCAASGVAFIFGPDGEAYGVDIYRTGVAVIGVGLFILAIPMALAGVARVAAAMWIAAVLVTLGGDVVGRAAEGFALAGVFFGAGFVAAGATLLAPRSYAPDRASAAT